ncbi:threonine-phosphate decarboxylase CobD [Undibacterium sp.]|uniref:threonine-phosphate decarboxylase CobD n=1 Tax=Undibacterium sp. TaxID=1914977 RepID=UPI00374D9DA9
MLEHGGNLNDAVRHFGRPLHDWVDLSTGINPRFYPAPQIADNAWHRLPEKSDALQAAAQAFYGAPHMLAVAGTQAAIQALPRLRPTCRVVVSAPSYAEHAYQWRQGGHDVREVPYAELAAAVPDADVVVICNPNNPTGAGVLPQMLLQWAEQLQARGGWLVVDEAFADTLPGMSTAAWANRPGLIVLKSVGKFFGLAGVRLGFVAAEPALLARLETLLGPWAVSGPAQQIACAALTDTEWQQHTRSYLQQQGDRLRALLRMHGCRSSGTDLFQWCVDGDLRMQTEELWRHLAEQGIWVRLFKQAARGLRFGLPADDAAWQRLEQAFALWTFKK